MTAIPAQSIPAPSGDTSAEKRPALGIWEALALFSILLLALGLRTWNLEQNNWGAEYYTAAVRSMALNWHNFFYAAFDPAGFISVDKPPVSLWLQVVSVKLFGLHPYSVLLPQALEGVASVALLFHLVRRRFSPGAALLAALFFAVTPVWVAVNRTNNTDSCLLLVLLLAAWALMKAAETGKRPMLLLAMALVGLGFNVKMLAAFIVLPAFYAVYLIAAPIALRRRLLDLALATAMVAVCAAPWVLTVELTPPDQRPFVGSSRHNSMLELVIGHNAMSRFVRRGKAGPETPSMPDKEAQARPAPAVAAADPDAEPDARSATRNIVTRLFVRAPTGPLRLADGHLAAQTGWLLPAALMALALGILQMRRKSAPAPLALRLQQVGLLFWFCWCLIYALVYSYLGGIIHFYYLSTLAPALAALAGIGTAELWRHVRERGSLAILLPLTLLATAAWQMYVQMNGLGWTFDHLAQQAGEWPGMLHLALGAGTFAALAGMLAARRLPANGASRMLALGSLACGIVALLVLPLAWAMSSVLLPGHGVMPSADLYRLIAASRSAEKPTRIRLGQAPDNAKLLGFLQGKRKGERWLLASSTTQFAAPLIIASGEPVMARGGFHGLDPAVDANALARMVDARQIRFAMLGDVAAVSRRMGADAAGKEVADWIRAHGKPVDPALWRSRRMGSAAELYDLRPDDEPPAPPAGKGS